MRTFSLGNDGADVVKFTSASSANANYITNFGTTDKLSFSATEFGSINWKATSGFTETFSSNNIADNKVYFGTAITDTAVTTDLITSNGSNVNALAITQTGKIYYIADNSGSITKSLVGSVNIDTLEDVNIEFVGS